MDDDITHICEEKNLVKLSKYLKKLTPHLISTIHDISLHSETEQGERIRKCIRELYFTPFVGTMTLTFGDVAESHVGMQKLGKMADNGFTLEDLQRASTYFTARGCEAIIIRLNDYLPDKAKNKEEQQFLDQANAEEDFQAYVLIVRGGLKNITNPVELATEMLIYDWDTKLYNDRKKQVQQKNARHNLNFDENNQDPDFTKGKGTTVSWADVPILKQVKDRLVDIFGKNAEDLKCEGNKYYEPKGTGIGYHGDTERRKVIGLRLGRAMNLHFMWYYNDRPRGYNVSFTLQPGDLYCMSEKTVGTDWRPNAKRGWTKKRYTLRHAAGAAKYTTDTQKIQVKPNKLSKNPNITLGDIYYKRKAGVQDKKTGTKTEWELSYN
jgi:hypothetical protein